MFRAAHLPSFTSGAKNVLCTSSHNCHSTDCGTTVNLKQIQLLSHANIQPLLSEKRTCGILLLIHQLQPEWSLVNCSEKVLFSTVCQIQKGPQNFTNQEVNVYQTKVKFSCSVSYVFRSKMCYRFRWFQGENYLFGVNCPVKTRSEPTAFYHTYPDLFMTSLFQTLIEAVAAQFPSVLMMFSGKMRRLRNERLMNIFRYEEEFVNASIAQGFLVTQERLAEFSFHNNVFPCTKGGHISILYKCDGKRDCPIDDSDEESCRCNKTADLKWVTCQEIRTDREGVKCGPLFHKTIKDTCVSYAVLSPKPEKKEKPLLAVQDKFSQVSCGMTWLWIVMMIKRMSWSWCPSCITTHRSSVQTQNIFLAEMAIPNVILSIKFVTTYRTAMDI